MTTTTNDAATDHKSPDTVLPMGRPMAHAVNGLLRSLAALSGAEQAVLLLMQADGSVRRLGKAVPIPGIPGPIFQLPDWVAPNAGARPVAIGTNSRPATLGLPAAMVDVVLVLDSGDLRVVLGWSGMPDAAARTRALTAWSDIAPALDDVVGQYRRHDAEMVRRVAMARVEADVDRLAETVAAARRLFLARMSHELRTPLNAIIGFSELIRTRALGPQAMDRYLRYVDDIHVSGREMLRLVDDLLDLARVEGHAQPIAPALQDLPALLHGPLDIIRQRAERAGLSLQTDIPAGMPPLRADGEILKQAMLRLLDDALHACRAGGGIRLRAKTREDGSGHIDVETDGRLTVMLRADTMATADAHDVDPAIRQADSTGVNLPLVAEAIERHGGRMTVSPGDMLTRIQIALPGLET
ncbi:sensor histidine kinase [Tistrella mobilis]|uniref:histidine kinase n=1 Tax=Tistrella mobilis (strain KA081020-065) TaxID=1110502 RepID=I3TV04_TISMK|nr:HAMP domain-containing sensor histidine kinase [Tistrella mobilis]AFK56592.1 Sensor protein [Tistrella mobilis KA081020-065]